jgi:renalase
MTRIAIIGAGLSGLTVASILKDFADITIFEKSRGVSGRLSTRREEPYYFDHGAQYFTARTKEFQSFIQPMVDIGVIQRWDARYVKFDDNQIIDNKNWIQDEPRYVGVPTMNAMAKHLAVDLDINFNTKIIGLTKEINWRLESENSNCFKDFDWVISTAPAPQTVALLPQNFIYYEEVKTLKMRPCFSLMLGFVKPLDLGFEAAHIINSDLSWLAVNSSKPGRPEPYMLMAHSSAEYAEMHIDGDRVGVASYLCHETSRIIGFDVGVAASKSIHGWRYASNEKRQELPVLLDTKLQISACGDWCVGGRVEGAFMSAHNLAWALAKNI